MILEIVIAAAANFLLALGALLKKAVTPKGAVTGFILGALLFILGSWVMWSALVLFFLTGTFFGRIRRYERSGVESVAAKSGARDWFQVSANCLPSVLLLVPYAATGSAAWLVASFGAMAAAAADTWASELGVLSRQRPRSILTGEPVTPGISGGITLFGTAASFVGALAIALLSLISPVIPLRGALIVTVSGFFGSVVDSFLGAGVQAKYLHAETGTMTERADGNTLVAGRRWMTNDLVNFLSVTASGAFGLAAAAVFI